MKTSYARMVFGASAVLFGVIALRWHDADTWQELRHIWSLPFGIIIGEILMIAQIAGGIGIQFPRATRVASITLCVVYLIFSLACVAGIVAAPTVYAQYESFCEQFSLVCGATALYAMSGRSEPRAVAFGRLARLGLAVCALGFALAQVVYLRFTASLVPRWILPNQMFWAIFTTIAFALAGIAILTHRRARLAVHLMILMLALFGLLVWVPRLVTHPEAHENWSEFALTFLIAGATWTVAGLKSI